MFILLWNLKPFLEHGQDGFLLEQRSAASTAPNVSGPRTGLPSHHEGVFENIEENVNKGLEKSFEKVSEKSRQHLAFLRCCCRSDCYTLP